MPSILAPRTKSGEALLGLWQIKHVDYSLGGWRDQPPIRIQSKSAGRLEKLRKTLEKLGFSAILLEQS
jgi:hypothetical protein